MASVMSCWPAIATLYPPIAMKVGVAKLSRFIRSMIQTLSAEMAPIMIWFITE